MDRCRTPKIAPDVFMVGPGGKLIPMQPAPIDPLRIERLRRGRSEDGKRTRSERGSRGAAP